MSNQNQFGEPWLALQMELHEGGTGVEIVDFKGQVVANNQTYYPAAVTPERATRIALCVSACARIPNENLDGVLLHEKLLESSAEMRHAAIKGAEATQQRDELLESLKGILRIVEAFSYSNMLGKSQGDRMRAARELIKKIESPQ